MLGSSKGGLTEQDAIEILKRYLSNCEIPVELYQYDPNAKDDLYKSFVEKLYSYSIEELCNHTSIRKGRLSKLIESIANDKINSISQLSTIQGIGLVTLEKSFMFCMGDGQQGQVQMDIQF